MTSEQMNQDYSMRFLPAAMLAALATTAILMSAPPAVAQKTVKHPAKHSTKQHPQRKVITDPAPIRLSEAARKRVFWEHTVAVNEAHEAAEKRYPQPANEHFDDTSPWAKQVSEEANRLIAENLKKLGHKWGLTRPQLIAIATEGLEKQWPMAAEAGAAPRAWMPDAHLIKQLAPAKPLTDDYQIQPPEGFTFETTPGPLGSVGKAWVSAPRAADGTCVYVMFFVITPPKAEIQANSLQRFSDGMLKALQAKRANFKVSPTETGTINGITFIRTYWQGTDKETGFPMHGFTYLAQDGEKFLALSAQDIDTYQKTTLPLMETSALTFKKKG